MNKTKNETAKSEQKKQQKESVQHYESASDNEETDSITGGEPDSSSMSEKPTKQQNHQPHYQRYQERQYKHKKSSSSSSTNATFTHQTLHTTAGAATQFSVQRSDVDGLRMKISAIRTPAVSANPITTATATITNPNTNITTISTTVASIISATTNKRTIGAPSSTSTSTTTTKTSSTSSTSSSSSSSSSITLSPNSTKTIDKAIYNNNNNINSNNNNNNSKAATTIPSTPSDSKTTSLKVKISNRLKQQQQQQQQQSEATMSVGMLINNSPHKFSSSSSNDIVSSNKTLHNINSNVATTAAAVGTTHPIMQNNTLSTTSAAPPAAVAATTTKAKATTTPATVLSTCALIASSAIPKSKATVVTRSQPCLSDATESGCSEATTITRTIYPIKDKQPTKKIKVKRKKAQSKQSDVKHKFNKKPRTQISTTSSSDSDDDEPLIKQQQHHHHPHHHNHQNQNHHQHNHNHEHQQQRAPRLLLTAINSKYSSPQLKAFTTLPTVAPSNTIVPAAAAASGNVSTTASTIAATNTAPSGCLAATTTATTMHSTDHIGLSSSDNELPDLVNAAIKRVESDSDDTVGGDSSYRRGKTKNLPQYQSTLLQDFMEKSQMLGQATSHINNGATSALKSTPSSTPAVTATASTIATPAAAAAAAHKSLTSRAELLANFNTNSQTESIASSTGACGTASVSGSISAANSVTTNKNSSNSNNNKKATTKTIAGGSTAKKRRGRPKKPVEESTNTAPTASAVRTATAIEIDTNNRGLAAVAANINESADSGVISTASTTQSTTPSPRMPTTTGTPTRSTRKSDAKLNANLNAISQLSPAKSLSGLDASNSNTSNATTMTTATAASKPKIDIAYLDKRMYATERVLYPPPRNKRRQSLKLTSNSASAAQSTSNANSKTTKEEIQLDPVWRKIDVNKKFRRPSLSGYKSDGGGGNTTICSKVLAAKSGYVSDYGSFHPRSNRHHNPSQSGYKSDASCKSRYSMRSCVSRRSRAKSCGYRSDCKDSGTSLLKSAKYRRKRRASILMHAPHMPHTAKSVVDLSDVQDILQLAGLSLGQSSEESNEYVCKPSLASLPTTSASKKYGEINRFIATGEYFGRGSSNKSGTHLSGQQGKRSYDLGNEEVSQDGYSAAAFSGKLLLQRKNSHISDIANDLLVPHAGTLRKIKSRRSSVASYCSSFYSGTSKVRRRRRRKSFRFPTASSGKNTIIDSKLLTDIDIITSTFHNLCSLNIGGSSSGGTGNANSGVGGSAGPGVSASVGAGATTTSTGERTGNHMQPSIGTLSGKEKLIAEANKLQQSLSIAVANNIASTATSASPAVTATAIGSSLIGASAIVTAGVVSGASAGAGLGVGLGFGAGSKGRDKRALKKRKVNENLVDFAMLSASAAAAQTPSSGSTKRRHKKANSSSPDDHKLPLKKRHYLLTPGEKPIEATLSMSAKMYANSTEAWAAAAAAAKTTASTKSQQQFNAQKTAKSGITPKKRHLLHNAIVAAPYLLEETPSIKSNKSSKSSNSSPLRIVVDPTSNSISGGKLLDISPISLSSLKQQTDAKKRTRLEGLVTKIAHDGVTTTTSTIITTPTTKDSTKPNTKSIIGTPQIDAETSCPPPGVFEPSVELEIQIPPIAKLTETAASIITKSEVDSPLLGLELPNACTKTEGARVVETLLNKTGGNLILKRKRKKINRTGFPTVRRKKRKINENLLLDVTPDLLANVPKVVTKTTSAAAAIVSTKATKSIERCKSVGTMTTNERSSVCDRVPQTGETSDTFLERANRTPRLSVVALERLQGTPTATLTPTATVTLRATPTATPTAAASAASTNATRTTVTTPKAGSSIKGSVGRQTPVAKHKSQRQKTNSTSNQSNNKNTTPDQQSEQLPQLQQQQQKTPVGRPSAASKKSKLLRTEAVEEKPQKSTATKPIKIVSNVRVSGRKSKATMAAAAAAAAAIQEAASPLPIPLPIAAVIAKTPTTKPKKSARQNAAAARETPTTKASSGLASAAATTPLAKTAAIPSATPTKASTKTRRKSPILTARALQAQVKLPAGIDPNTNFSCKIRLKRRNTLHPLALNNEQSAKCNSPSPPEFIEAEAAAKATLDIPIEHDILPLSECTVIDPEATTSDTSDEKSSSASTSHNNVPRKQGRWRKNYLPAGLFSDYFKVNQPSKLSKKNAAAAAAAAGNGSNALVASTTPGEKQDATTAPTGTTSDNGKTIKSLLPPPPYCEKYFRRTQRDFELPFDIWWAYKNSKLPTRNTVPSWNYRKIRTNIYADSVRPNTAGLDHPTCNCKFDTGCTDNCLNRMVYTECSPSNCPTRDKCHNQKIQRHEVAPGVERFMTEDKGWGVRTKMPIQKGTYILEYVGEVVTEREFKDRMGTIYRNDTHHYCLHLDGGLVIDGHRMGSDGRFVNHSCEPNCEMQKWSVNGLSRMALFAKRHIDSDEELTYDYNFALFNPAEGQPCFCKTSQCRGVIGGKSQRIKPLPSEQKPAEVTLKDGRNKRQRKHKASKNAQPQRHTSKDVVVAHVQQMTEREKKLVKQTGIFMLRTFEKIRRCNAKRLRRTASNSHNNTTSTSATNSTGNGSGSGTTTATTPTSHIANGAINSANHGTGLTITNRRPSTPASLAAQISALCTPRSIKTRGLSLAVQDPELEKMAKMAVILRDICTTLETLKMANDETKTLASILQANSNTNDGSISSGSINSSSNTTTTTNTTTITTATTTNACSMGKKKKMLKAAAAAAQTQKQDANDLKSVQANIEQGFYKQPIDFDVDMQQVFHELRRSMHADDVDKQQALAAFILAYEKQKQQHYDQLLQLIGDENMLKGFCVEKQQQRQLENVTLNGVLQGDVANVSDGKNVDGNGNGGGDGSANGSGDRNANSSGDNNGSSDNNGNGNGDGDGNGNASGNGSGNVTGSGNGSGNGNGNDDGKKDRRVNTTNSGASKTATKKATTTEAATVTVTTTTTTTTTTSNNRSISINDNLPATTSHPAPPATELQTETQITPTPILASVPLPLTASLLPAISNANSTEDIIRCICGLYKDEGLMIQCARCMVWQHTECTKADIDADHYLCECCEPRNVDREIPLDDYTEDGHRYYLSLMRGELQVRQGDAVYVLRDIPIKDATGKEVMKHTYETIGSIDFNECDIFRVERLWKTEAGKRFIFGHHFLRPHETFHEPTRRFYPNEVVRVPLYEVVPIELVIGRCWVLDRTTFCKGRPIECTLEEHCYICELRVDKTARFFSKAKINYPSCTKSYAFRKFPEKLRISKTYAPHVVDPAMLKKKHRNSTNDSSITSSPSVATTTASSLANTNATHTPTATTSTATTKQEQTKAAQQHGRKINKNSNNPVATPPQLGIAASSTVTTQVTAQTTKEKRSHLENVLRTLKLQKKFNNPQLFAAEPAVDLTYLLTGRGARQRKHNAAVNTNTLITTTLTALTTTTTSSSSSSLGTTTEIKITVNSPTEMGISGKTGTSTKMGATGSTTSAGAATATTTKQTTHTTHTIATFSSTITTGTSNLKTTTKIA